MISSGEDWSQTLSDVPGVCKDVGDTLNGGRWRNAGPQARAYIGTRDYIGVVGLCVCKLHPRINVETRHDDSDVERQALNSRKE